MGHHLVHDPLVPGMSPMHTRVLAVGGDTTRLELLATNLRLRGYQVTRSTDPAAAMAGLLQSISFDLVIVDTTWPEYLGGPRVAAEKLFEFAIREPLLCAYAIKGEETYGPLAIEDLDAFMKTIYNVESNVQTSPKDTQSGPCNTSLETTTSTITNLSFLGRRAERRSKIPSRDIDSEEVEQDGNHVEKEQQQPAQNLKKCRFVWTDELHNKFLEAIDELIAEEKSVVPINILQSMKDSTPTSEIIASHLTREIIASHLQKHRFNVQSEACTDPVRRSHSRMKHHTSTSQAVFPSHNKVSQQQVPPTIMQTELSAAVYINYDSAHTLLEASTKSDMQDSRVVFHMQTTIEAMDKSNQSVLDDVPLKDMYPGAAEPKQNSCVGSSDCNGLHEDFTSEILNNELEPPWENTFLFSSSD